MRLVEPLITMLPSSDEILRGMLQMSDILIIKIIIVIIIIIIIIIITIVIIITIITIIKHGLRRKGVLRMVLPRGIYGLVFYLFYVAQIHL